MKELDISSYSVNFHDLEALRDVSWVGGQTRATGYEAHEQNAFLVRERLEHLPEPLHQLVGFLDLTVPATKHGTVQI